MGKLKPDLSVTNFPTYIASACYGGLANHEGLVIIGWYKATTGTTAPTTASIFAPGCILFLDNGTSAATNIVVNSGTAASPTWTAKTID